MLISTGFPESAQKIAHPSNKCSGRGKLTERIKGTAAQQEGHETASIDIFIIAFSKGMRSLNTTSEILRHRASGKSVQGKPTTDDVSDGPVEGLRQL